MHTELETLEILILLKCHKKLASRSYISRTLFKHPKKEREKALSNLIKNGLIIAKEMPKPGATVLPVFYKITDIGNAWVKDYLDNYPKT